ncbi:MAG: HD-GYP domain-containing protein [Chloroflexi bacterium]|nr:HD-GYP domain-containing protein [Chloroflexota bacterium]
MSSDFLCESLAPFEMTIRGFKEANQSLRTLNETLEERVQERTEELERTVGTLQRVLGGTVEAISTIVEKRDPYTAGHQQRVSLLACAIAEEMGLTRKQIDGIDIAGVIHDIGKIAIPSEILSTPRQLSGNEFDLIRIHSQAGYDILKTIEFPWPVAQIVLQHHERMDGSGYPAGLAGEDILPEARIIAVADVVEAMSSHRPYRPALGVAKALEEIYEKKGVFYDAPVVDACLALFIERGFKFE